MKKIILFLSILFTASVVQAKNPAPTLVADFTASATVICAGQSVTFTDLTTENPNAWTWTFDGGTPASSTLQNPTVVYNTPGNYTVRLKADNGIDGDEEDKIEFIKVLGNPNSTFSASSNQCLTGNSFSFTCNANDGTDAWTFPGGNPSTSTVHNPTGITFSTAGNKTISHTVTTSDGCTSTSTVTVTVFSSPTGLAVTTTPSNCASSTGSITIGTVTGGTAPFQYAINNGTFSSATSYPSKPPGNYQVTVKDAHNCTFTVNVIVGSSGGPTALAATVTPTTCANVNGIIVMGAVTGGVSPYTYAVDVTPFTSATTYNNLSTGIHTIKVKDANGCIFSRNVNVLNTQPTAVVTSSTASGCSPATGTITLGAVTGGRSPYTFNLDGGTFTSSTTFTAVSAGTHTIVVKDVTGCSFVTTVTVAQIPGPTAVASSGTFSACSSPTGTATISGPIGGTAPFTFSFNGGAFSSTNTFSNLAAGTYPFIVKDANGCTLASSVTIANTPGPTALAVTSSASACTAATGSITLGAVTGGTAPYTFSFNGSAFTTTVNYTGLAAGTYTIVVKDANGCTFTKTVVLTNTQPTDVVLTAVPSTCGSSNGSIAVGLVTGGVGPFVYSLNTSAFTATTNYTSLAAGTYTITVKDFNGCTFSKSVTVTNSAPTNVATTTTNSACNSSTGSITIGAVTGGIAPYTFSINGSAFTATTNYTSLAAGGYVIVVKDANGCTFTTNVVVSSAGGPSSVAVTASPSTCGLPNGSLTIGAVTGGVAPYTFTLNNGTFTSATNYPNLAAGNYSVMVKDANGCIFTTIKPVNGSNGPTDFATTQVNTTCGSSNGTITVGAVTGGTSPFTYSVDGGAFGSANSFANLASGNHTVSVKDLNGCVFTKSVTLTNATGPFAINITPKNAGCQLPNDGSFTINSVSGGTAPYTYSVNGGLFTSVTGYNFLTAGTYTITVKDANGCTLTTTQTLLNVPHAATAISTLSIPPGCGLSNGSINVTSVTGGTAPYQISVVGTSLSLPGPPALFSGLPSGNYSISVTDVNGCGVSFGLFQPLLTPGAPSAFSRTIVNTTCGLSNGSVTITGVTGGISPYTYSVNGSAFTAATTFNGLPSGVTIPVVIKDANGCTLNGIVVLNNSGIIPATPVISQNGFLLTSSATTGNQWFFNGVPIAGQTGQTHFAQFNGSYTVVVSNGTCSSAPSAPVIITNQGSRTADPNHPTVPVVSETISESKDDVSNTNLLAAPEMKNAIAMQVYPNPNDGNFIVSFESANASDYTIEVFNVFGQSVMHEELNGFSGAYSKEMHLVEFGSGFYSVVLTSREGKTVQKIVVY